MAKKTATKPGTGKKERSGSGSRKTTKTPSPRREVNQGPLALLLLLALVLILGLGARYFLRSPSHTVPPDISKTHKQPAVEKPTSPPKLTERGDRPSTPQQELPRYEVFPKQDMDRKRSSSSEGNMPEKPKIAIIIDDIGYDMAMADAFMALDIPLTFSILPHSPHGIRIADKAHVRGYEIMLHLPMEPEEYPRIDPGPGGLFLSMQADDLIAVLQSNLGLIPHVRGVNNHMGSALTPSEPHMNQIFSILKKKGLFFIDSRTAAQSRSRAAARMFQVPFGERDIFLDHVQHAEEVKTSLERLLRIAEKHGSSIGIGHPHRVTLEGLQTLLSGIRNRYTFVYASELTDFVE